MIHRILIALFFLFAGSQARAEEPAFAVGQTWRYETRKGEGDSRLVILRIDDAAKEGRIVHVGIVGAKLVLAPGQPAQPWQIDHMPFAEVALRRSVTKLEAEPSKAVFPEFEPHYVAWKKVADAGNRQMWSAPVSKAVGDLEKMILSRRK